MGSFRNSPTTGITLDDATQRVSGGSYFSNSTVDSCSASATAANCSGIRFRSISQLAPNENIRSARLSLRYNVAGAGSAATTGAKYDIFGHKVANSPAFLSGTSGTGGANDVFTRLTALTSASVQVRISSAPDSSIQYVYDVTAIIQEIIGQPGGATTGWAAGNAITFILKGYADATFTTSIASYDSVTGSPAAPNLAVFPELYVDYGTIDPSAFSFDLVSAGDSHGQCAVNAGAVATNVPVLVWPSQIIAETARGLVGSTAGGTTAYFGVFADYRRGYTVNGIANDSISTKYNDPAHPDNAKVLIFQSEYAIGGTRCSVWADDTVKTDGTGMWDGINGSQPSLNSRIKNPKSPSRKMIMWWSNIGNDLFNLVVNAASTTTLIVPRGTAWGSTDWSDAGDMTKWRNQMVKALETNFTHAFAQAALAVDSHGNPAPTDLRIVCPGYHNFQVFGPAAGPNYHYIPSTTGDALERSVWSTQGYGFYAQINYDLITSQVRAGGDRFNQSTYVKFAAQYQITTYGSWDPNNSAQWNIALGNTLANPLAGATWTHPISGTSTDGWRDGMRNITDITVNTYMVGEIHAIYQRVVDLHPEWFGKLFFLPHPQAINAITGNDPQTADNTSVYAQPLWQGSSSVPGGAVGKFEGIHMCSRYFRWWVDAIINDLDTKIDFLPGYIPPTDATTYTIDRINPSSGAVITPSVSSLVVGWSYQINITDTAVGAASTGRTLATDTLTHMLGSPTATVIDSTGTTTVAATPLVVGHSFAMPNLAINAFQTIRVKGTCVA